MLIRTPTPDVEQIGRWLEEGAKSHVPLPGASARGIADTRSSPAIDFKKVSQALKRARAKADINTVKPLRRLRTNQGAINESLMDAISALLTKNKLMALELEALGRELGQLRSQLAYGERVWER